MANKNNSQKKDDVKVTSQNQTTALANNLTIEDTLDTVTEKIRDAFKSLDNSVIKIAYYVNYVAEHKLTDIDVKEWASAEFNIGKTQFYNYCAVAKKFLKKDSESGEIVNTISDSATFTQLSYLASKELKKKDLNKAIDLINKGYSQKNFETVMNKQLGIAVKGNNSDNSKKGGKKTDNNQNTGNNSDNNQPTTPISQTNLAVIGEDSDRVVEFFKVFVKHALDFASFLETQTEKESYKKIAALTKELTAIYTALPRIAAQIMPILEDAGIIDVDGAIVEEKVEEK